MTLTKAQLIKEQERLNRIREFDEKATGLFIDEFVRILKKYLRGKVPDPKSTAIDLAHQVVAALYCKENLVLNCKLMTYAVNIGTNLFSNEQQKKFNRRTDVQPPDFFDRMEAEEDIYKQIEESEVKLLVNNCLKSLSERCQKLLRSFMSGVPAGDASRQLGYTSSKIYQVRKSECMTRFQQEVINSGNLANLL